MRLPKIVKVVRNYEDNSIQDIESHVEKVLKDAGIDQQVKPGQKIAITMGSRGIDRIDRVLRTVGKVLKGIKAEPYIVLGMGSHGGGTVEGQLKIAEKFGVTEESMGMPIKATMEVVRIGTSPNKGIPVFIDKYAAEADGILMVHRIKYHRHIMGPHQSGFLKMIAIGLGKKIGAATIHSYGWEKFPENVLDVASLCLPKLPMVMALGIVENAFSKTAILEAVEPDKIIAKNSELLQKSLSMIPYIPFKKIDVLVLQEMGKNVPPDTNVLGKALLSCYTERHDPNPTRMVALDLHSLSMGNAAGMGSFDYITQRFLKKIDYGVTAINCIAASLPEAGFTPVPLPTDRLAVEAAIQNSGYPEVEEVADPDAARLVFIKNTSDMKVLFVSECLVDQIIDKATNHKVGEPFDILFDEDGNLCLDFSV
jgi:lactate racemase-like protein